jgi:hypothetical protein
MDLMDRHNNLRAFEHGARAMLDLGIKVKVDLIIGLPGDTVDSVRRGIEYVRNSALYTQVQVFNLAILPGTSFRQEAAGLGLRYQDRPPYYVLETPTLSTEQMYDLMAEAEDAFETEFDPLPEVQLPAAPEADEPSSQRLRKHWKVDLDDVENLNPPPATNRAQAFTLWLQSSHFNRDRRRAAELVSQLLAESPFTTLQIVIEPTCDARLMPDRLTSETCEALLAAAFRHPTYLDRFYSVSPGRIKGAKRLIVLLPAELESHVPQQWLNQIERRAAIVWRETPNDKGPMTSDESVTAYCLPPTAH